MSDIRKVPEGWLISRVRDFSHVQTGTTPPKNNPEYYSKAYPFYKPTDLAAGENVFNSSDGLSELGIRAARYVPENSTLITCIGATIGKTGFIKKGGGFNQQINSITPFYPLNPKYIYLQAISHYFQSQIIRNASATTLPILNKGRFELLEMFLPPLAEQHRIVARLEELFTNLDKGIETLKTAQQQLKIYRQSVLKWAFEGKLTNKDVKEGELPEGWKWVDLKQLCDIRGGATKGRNFKENSTIHLPYLRVANVQDGYLDLKVIKTIEVLETDLEKYRLIFGDILYTEGGDRDKLGRGTIWKNEIEDCIHQNHIFRARPVSENINPKFISYYSQTQRAKQYFLKHGKQTTNLASINITVLSSLPIPIPESVDEQHQIVAEIESRLSVCDKIEETISQSLQQAEALRQSILKKAFEGTLVAQDPNDEPASVLLERIRAERQAQVKIKPVKTKKVKKAKAERVLEVGEQLTLL